MKHARKIKGKYFSTDFCFCFISENYFDNLIDRRRGKTAEIIVYIFGMARVKVEGWCEEGLFEFGVGSPEVFNRGI